MDLTTHFPPGVIAPYDWADSVISVVGVPESDLPAVDAAVTAAMRVHGIVGAGVCITSGSKVIFAKGYGWAAIGERPFLPTTATRCGSLAKPVTALCALLLAERGALDLDAPILPILARAGFVPTPVGGYMPDFRIDRITARHLMDHTSGLPATAAYTAWRENRNLIAIYGLHRVPGGADAVGDALGNSTLDSEPGETYQYANANFVILARLIESVTGEPFRRHVPATMAAFGLLPDDIYVSRNQIAPETDARGSNEATYYQTSAERYVSFEPERQADGMVFGEAYRGYATEVSDGAGGLACSAVGLGRILANLHSDRPAISTWALDQIVTPPEHALRWPDFDPAAGGFYSKGFQVRIVDGLPGMGHGGMTNHCGGVIGHAGGYQFVSVSNWQAPGRPYVDTLLGNAIRSALASG